MLGCEQFRRSAARLMLPSSMTAAKERNWRKSTARSFHIVRADTFYHYLLLEARTKDR
jgi:hypothetical protein